MKIRSFQRIAIAVLLWSLPSTLHAYCSVPEIRPSGEYYQSDVVFIGTVLSERSLSDGGYYRLRLVKVYRGEARKSIDIFAESGSNSFFLAKGKTYLLFAHSRSDRLEIDNCGNSALLSDAGASVSEIERLRLAEPFGVIEGWVAGETEGVNVSGIKVTVRSRARSHSAVTDSDGRFEIRVPAGRYQIDFSSHEYYLNAYDSFWYDPRHFVLHPGETASLQVVSVRHPSKTPETKSNQANCGGEFARNADPGRTTSLRRNK